MPPAGPDGQISCSSSFSFITFIFISSYRSCTTTHIAKSMEIPQDIIDNVIAAVGDDTHSLKQCSLVSSSFLLPSRKQLFSTITISSDETCQGIHQFLVQNPVIQSFVKSIIIMDSERSEYYSLWMNSASLLAILRLPFCRLDSFAIINYLGWSWNFFSSEMKDALSNIILSSTLKFLYLSYIANLPIAFLLQITHLKTLVLDSLTPNDFFDEYSSPLTQAASKRAAASHTVPVIDNCVWHFGDRHNSHE
jgi:hypothetical protein